MKHPRRILWPWRTALVVAFALFAASTTHAQSDQKSKVVVIVTDDDAPCPWAKVTIRPKGTVEGWPEGKTEIVLKADDHGHATANLGAGVYWVKAVDSIGAKEPEAGPLKIKSGMKQPIRIRLALRYWDCAHVTCKL